MQRGFRGVRVRAQPLLRCPPVLRVALILLASLLAGCGDPGNCADVADPDADAASFVHDPLFGQHMGTLTWLETMKTTSVVLTVTATGPVSHLAPTPSSDSCTGRYIALDASVQTGDGLIKASFMPQDSMTFVDTNGKVAVHLHLAVDPAPILAGGAAPEQPKLSAQTATADLSVDRAASGAPTGGTLTIASPDANVTLATVAF
jgi:hypothetical protein